MSADFQAEQITDCTQWGTYFAGMEGVTCKLETMRKMPLLAGEFVKQTCVPWNYSCL